MLIGRNGDKGQSLLWTSLPALSRTVQEGDVDVVDSQVSREKACLRSPPPKEQVGRESRKHLPKATQPLRRRRRLKSRKSELGKKK